MTSEIKVNKVSDSCGSAMIEKCGSTITVGTPGKNVILGASGQTVSIAGGATTSGMGRTGTVDWCTTAKTSPFSGVNGKGYFINTTCGAVTLTLPTSPTAGDIIAISDYANKFDTNNVTIGRGGSKINGACADSTLSTQGQSVTLVYVDGTRGWKTVTDSTANVTGETDYNVQYLVIAGGGSGSSSEGGVGHGGGGAGGFREISLKTFTVTKGTSYPITVGAGASASPGYCGAANGTNSTFSTITSAGGGGGGSGFAGPSSPPYGVGSDGGSGGGGGKCTSTGHNGRPGGSGNVPPVSPPQGNDGGTGSNTPNNNAAGGGGGGAGATGQAGGPSGGDGGAGSASTIFGSSPIAPTYGVAPNPSNTGPGRYFAGGGGGGWHISTSGGHGGGVSTPSGAGTANTGGGGSGRPQPGGAAGGTGGSGIIVIRHLTADGGSGGNATGTCGSDTIRVFTASGTFTA
jgi:hypothetical protein